MKNQMSVILSSVIVSALLLSTDCFSLTQQKIIVKGDQYCSNLSSPIQYQVNSYFVFTAPIPRGYCFSQNSTVMCGCGKDFKQKGSAYICNGGEWSNMPLNGQWWCLSSHSKPK